MKENTEMNVKLLRRFSSFLLLLTVLSAVVLAQQPAQQITPSVDRLREIVTYLASDALEGRRTGSPGANDAAHYIAGEFQRLGLRPGFPPAGRTRLRSEMLRQYFERFPYVAGVELGKGNTFSVHPNNGAPVSLRVGEDWMPLGFSSRGRFNNAQAVFVGYGITAAELKYDDYSGAEAKEKIAIAFAGTPDGDNPHGQFARYEDVRWRAIAARNAGARALIVIAHEENFKEDRLTRLHYDNSGGDAGLVVVVISRQVASTLLVNGKSGELDRLEKRISRRSLAKLAPAAGGAEELDLFSFTASFSLSTDILRQEVAASNVIGILEGSDPNLKKEAIVIGAHYDHLGRGGEGSLAPREGEIHHGADDNASGVAGLLELARIFSSQQPKPRRTIVFIAFSGEEEGLLGSSFYVKHSIVPLVNTVAMINMDMIGRMKGKSLIVGGVGSAQEWRALVDQENPPVAMTATMKPRVATDDGTTASPANVTRKFELTLNEDGYGPSDHSSFYAKQVPVLFFWTGSHEDYHKPSDTADKINYEGEARVVALVADIIRDVDKSDKRPTYAVAKSDSQGRSSGFRVYLGTIPNYADSNDGLLLDGIRDDSPASKAGLKAGDKIVKLAGREVKNVYDYTYALGEMKAGQEYEVEVTRGSEHLKFKITPAARK
jgi:aminopeptidase YwaD